jgi:hypothetical protein
VPPKARSQATRYTIRALRRVMGLSFVRLSLAPYLNGVEATVPFAFHSTMS